MNPIEEMKSGPVEYPIFAVLIVSSEENRGSEETLETGDNTSVMRPIERQIEKSKHLSRAFKSNDSALLLDGESRDPDRDEAVLAIR
jgi:hypothetical protein